LKLFGTIKNKKIVWDDKVKLVDGVGDFIDGTRVVVSIKEAKDVRTNQQNKLYWKWIEVIGDSLGYTKEESHSLIKYKFLLREEIIDGETNHYLKSTATLSKKEFSKLTHDILFWANDTFNIKLPNE
tara:strand:+ start:1574 stop:1954 length:381 start_codon:yes stop_codon:yes gene_type:complete